MASFLLWLGIILVSFNKNSMANYKLKSEQFGKQFDYLHILRASCIAVFSQGYFKQLIRFLREFCVRENL